MNQPSKKTSPVQATAKIASAIADKKAVKEFITNSTDQAKKAQEKVLDMSREGAEHFVKHADTVTKALHDTIGMSHSTMETCIECGNMTAEFAKDMSSEIFESANKAFSETSELTKELFACRTISDVCELQNKFVKNMTDNFFNQSTKLSEMMFEYTTEVLEPINNHVTQATEQFSKSLKV